MTTPASAAGNVAIGGISIRVTGPDGFCSEHEVPEGDALVVGTSPACGVRIHGDGIAPMHCTLSCEEGLLVIDDWDTGAGTYLNGQRIARQASAEPGGTVQIGEFRVMTAVLSEDSSLDSDDDTAPVDSEVRRADFDDDELEVDGKVVDDTDPFLPTFEAQSSSEVSSAARDLPAQGAERPSAPADASDVYDTYESDSSGYDSVPGESGAYDMDGPVGADDMTELLKIELDYLRTELAERDVRVAELEQSLEEGGAARDEDLPSREEVDALAGRLEELLAELDHSDERLKTMSELLRVSEEANVAAVEERTQMESWIGEVERRVHNWENEWHAERESLNRRITDLTAQRDEAESHGGTRESNELIQKLRQQITQLETETARLQAERSDLDQRIQAADVNSIEERIQQAVDAAMREERLQLSQERAEVARERATLMRQQEDLAAQPHSGAVTADVADLKIRAFREHLKEIRATEPNHRPASTMSQRLGKLWRKIDGRPLDTD
jgi:pSer/pThr/pTyr-binding forkhead associated (FHA) protein